MRTPVAVEIAADVGPAEWDRLVEQTRASPFMRHGWITSWLRAFGEGKPLLLTARRGETLVGLLPLQSKGGVVSAAANWHTPEFTPVATDPEVARVLLAAAIARARRRVDIPFLPRPGAAAALAAGIRPTCRGS